MHIHFSHLVVALFIFERYYSNHEELPSLLYEELPRIDYRQLYHII